MKDNHLSVISLVVYLNPTYNDNNKREIPRVCPSISAAVTRDIKYQI